MDSATESSDDVQIRQNFSQLYQPFFQNHGAIRKMVQTALQTDLSNMFHGRSTSNSSNKNTNSDTSAIGQYYRHSLGGDFLVAVSIKDNEDEDNCNDDYDVGNSNNNNVQKVSTTGMISGGASLEQEPQQRWTRQVLGGIGIRPCTATQVQKILACQACETQPTGQSDRPNSSPTANTAATGASESVDYYFEIQRLFVSPSFQRRGIGQILIHAIIDTCQCHINQQQQQQPYNSTNHHHHQQQRHLVLIATTPTILDPANYFYQSQGLRSNKNLP
jgi:GNAT superfamily N-acetyltransferase